MEIETLRLAYCLSLMHFPCKTFGIFSTVNRFSTKLQQKIKKQKISFLFSYAGCGKHPSACRLEILITVAGSGVCDPSSRRVNIYSAEEITIYFTEYFYADKRLHPADGWGAYSPSFLPAYPGPIAQHTHRSVLWRALWSHTNIPTHVSQYYIG